MRFTWLLLPSLLLRFSAGAASLFEINPPNFPPSNHVIAIVGPTLFDADKGVLATGAVVIIRGGKISDVGKVGATSIPTNAEIVDGRGLILLPGLIDSHFHIERDYEMPRIVLSHGVTSVRDPGQWIHIFDPVRKSA